MVYTHLNEELDYAITYKKRKTLGIYIDIYGNVELRVPRETSEEQVSQLLVGKWRWIIEKRKEMKEKSAGYKEKVYDHGEEFLYLGSLYPIIIYEGIEIKKDYVTFENESLNIYVKTHEEDRIKKALKRFYQQQCKMLVDKRIQKYQKYFKVKPRGIKISSNKKTWGTCDSKRQLTFNWKLAMAPVESIDYVVVHEMCHMVHLNHERSFWRLLGKLLPDYKERQNWLSTSSWKMTI